VKSWLSPAVLGIDRVTVLGPFAGSDCGGVVQPAAASVRAITDVEHNSRFMETLFVSRR